MRHAALYVLCLAGGLSGAVSASANDFEQAWSCALNPGKTLDEARAVSAQWLQAVRGMRGGEGISLSLRWPIAVPDSEGQFVFVVRAPSLATWGAFYDGYDPDSPAGKADEAFAEIAACSGSTLWEHIAIGADTPG